MPPATPPPPTKKQQHSKRPRLLTNYQVLQELLSQQSREDAEQQQSSTKEEDDATKKPRSITHAQWIRQHVIQSLQQQHTHLLPQLFTLPPNLAQSATATVSTTEQLQIANTAPQSLVALDLVLPRVQERFPTGQAVLDAIREQSVPTVGKHVGLDAAVASEQQQQQHDNNSGNEKDTEAHNCDEEVDMQDDDDKKAVKTEDAVDDDVNMDMDAMVEDVIAAATTATSVTAGEPTMVSSSTNGRERAVRRRLNVEPA